MIEKKWYMFAEDGISVQKWAILPFTKPLGSEQAFR